MRIFALEMTVRKLFLKLQEEIQESQGLQGVFDCQIKTRIIPFRGLYRILIITNNNNLYQFPQSKTEINLNEK